MVCHPLTVLETHLSQTSCIFPRIVSSFEYFPHFMYCDQRYILRPNSKKNSFRGNYSWKYGNIKATYQYLTLTGDYENLASRCPRFNLSPPLLIFLYFSGRSRINLCFRIKKEHREIPEKATKSKFWIFCCCLTTLERNPK